MTQLSPVHFHDVEQGSDEWIDLRCGKLTASTVRQIVTPTLKVSANDTSRAILNRLAAQRITGVVEDQITTEKMLRGHIDEDVARDIYAKKYHPVTAVGFITNDKFPGLGYSPDGLVGSDGLIEIKSRDPHLHLKTIKAVELGEGIPREYMAQIQTGLMVAQRNWCDFISFSHGMPMMVERVFPDPECQAAIYDAVKAFELSLRHEVRAYQCAVGNSVRYTPTDRIDYEGMMI